MLSGEDIVSDRPRLSVIILYVSELQLHKEVGQAAVDI
jgi:hypothetical protein